MDREESSEIYAFFQSKNVSPDELVQVRAAIFKVGCEFLSESEHDLNVTLLRCINYIVHVYEKVYLQ